jgi:uncharacterized protein
MEPFRFVADVHLGKLARLLRMLGFDVLYSNEASPAQLATTTMAEGRILLSKSVAFAQQASLPLLVIDSSNPVQQLQQVIAHFQLQNALRPFTRCLLCNGQLLPVPKAAIEQALQPGTRAAFNQFWQCTNCRRIYWEGSHYERMQNRLVEATAHTH